MTERTTNKIWAGIAAGVVTTAALAAAGLGGYRLGQRDDRTIEVVGTAGREGGELARTIVVDGDGWRHGGGPGPGFVLFPLLLIGLSSSSPPGVGHAAPGLRAADRCGSEPARSQR